MQKVVLITGASRGIGRACAEEFAKDNTKVIANYNKSFDKAKELGSKFSNIEIYKADMSNKAEIKKMAKYVLEKYGKIDVLINNVGISQTKLFTDITDDDWDNMIKTNLSSYFYMTREILPNMINNKNGCIINISSVWGITGGSCEMHYSMTKARNNWNDKSTCKRSRTFKYKSKCNSSWSN